MNELALVLIKKLAVRVDIRIGPLPNTLDAGQLRH